ncbi:MAG: hypothetical protein ACTSVE_12125 [Candidatus Helarchaeota archaeon]
MNRMNGRKHVILLLLLFSGIVFTISISSIMNISSNNIITTNSFLTTSAIPTISWGSNGSLASTNSSDQRNPQICASGDGSAIIIWEDLGSGVDLYAQKMNSNGQTDWTTSGVVICDAVDSQYWQEMISDGEGGAIITWEDLRGSNYDVYAQKINATGHVQWQANGVAICNQTLLSPRPQLCSDGDGGAIIVWGDRRNGAGNYDIYAQRIDKNGVQLWGANGTVICDLADDQKEPKIVSDGEGGAIIAWRDNRTDLEGFDIYAQRVNGEGTPQWIQNGFAICSADLDQTELKICSDGSHGAIISWVDNRGGGDKNIFAQRIDGDGNLKWTHDGVIVCTKTNDQEHHSSCSDGNGGVIIAWDDSRDFSISKPDIYAQRINSAGIAQWTSNGIPVCNQEDFQEYPNICPNGNGGAYITWRDTRDADINIYGQEINSQGQAQWSLNGTSICNANGTTSDEYICYDGSGGVFIAWEDKRYVVSDDIYAQHVIGQIFPENDGGGSIWDILNANVSLLELLIILTVFTIINIIIHQIYIRKVKRTDENKLKSEKKSKSSKK